MRTTKRPPGTWAKRIWGDSARERESDGREFDTERDPLASTVFVECVLRLVSRVDSVRGKYFQTSRHAICRTKFIKLFRVS